MQDYTHQTFERFGHLWDRDKILLKITEELGELIQAFRKKDVSSQHHEFGDLVFSIFALAEREGYTVETELCAAVLRFEKYCNQLAKKEIESHRTIEAEVLSSGGYASSDTTLPVLTNDYPRRCSMCKIRPVHKTNKVGICPNCYPKHR